MRTFLLSAVVALPALLAPHAHAGPGTLDPTFGGGKGFGTAVLNVSPIGGGVAMQPDGKIVVVGTLWNSDGSSSICVARFTAGGALDTTFASVGYTILPVSKSTPGASDRGVAVAVQADGKIVAAGMSSDGDPNHDDIQVARLLADGSLDNSFGMGGRAVTDVNTGASDILTFLAIQPDGRILAGGSSYNHGPAPYNDVSFVRYNTDGSLDMDFGSGGKVFIDFDGFDDGQAIALSGNKILVAARSNGESTGFRFGVARCNSDGSLDTTFGDGTGIVLTTAYKDFYASSDVPFSMAVQADGKIVLVGLTADSVEHTQGYLLERYNADGSFDTTFGDQGFVMEDVGGAGGRPASVLIDSAGRIVVAGTFSDYTTSSFLLLRYLASGSRDTSFGSGGKVSVASGGIDEMLFGATLQADGKIVAFGAGTPGGASDFGLIVARYLAVNKAPTLSLNGRTKITTKAASVVLKGTATDDIRVASVSVNKKAAKGTSPWSYKAKLKKGRNKLVIMATDDEGATSAPVTVTVTRKK
jgi:uncharacterized delta-60 repeat protein